MSRGAIALLLLSYCTAAYAQTDLQVLVTGGDGAINRVGRPVAKEPSVRVLDRMGHPVRGAAVGFVVPSVGAGAEFEGGQTTLVVTSDEDGNATASGLRANNIAGQFEIRVNASHRGSRTTSRIVQTNVASATGARWLTGKRAVILALAAGAVVGGAWGLVPGVGAPDAKTRHDRGDSEIDVEIAAVDPNPALVGDVISEAVRDGIGERSHGRGMDKARGEIGAR